MAYYNRLMLNHISLTTLLVGTSDILNAKHLFIQDKRHQLVGRFMVHEHHFHGVRSLKDLQICLASYDKMLEYPIGSGWTYTKYFFPDGYEKGYRLYNDADIIFNCFTELMEKAEINSKIEIPMQYVILTINICLKTFGADRKRILQPTLKEWKDSIINSGYIQAEKTYIAVERA